MLSRRRINKVVEALAAKQRRPTTHILPSLSKRKDAPLCAQVFAIEISIVDHSYALLTYYTHCHFKILCAYLRNSA